MSDDRIVHVAAAVIADRAGRVLVALRPEGAHQGGLWEFPGGKLEPGEGVYEGLQRELHEELGIEVDRARPLLRLTHHYGDRCVLLDVWKVEAFRGRPYGREGQPLQWVAPEALPELAMPAADRPIVNAVRLPDHYMISGDSQNEADFLRHLRASLASGVRLLQLRAHDLDESAYRARAESALRECRPYQARLLLNAAPELVQEIGADGVHLSSMRLTRTSERPLPENFWVAASCHNADELRHAVEIGVDFAVLSPVQATATHPGVAPLGWERARQLLDDVALPVYLLGGVGPDALPRAWDCGAQGVAGIRAFWGRGCT